MIAMLAIICLPPVCRAAGAEESEYFASFEELQQLCGQALETPGVNLVCTSQEVIDISEDLTIPPDTMVTFWRFRIPEGVTLTISESAMLMTITLRVMLPTAAPCRSSMCSAGGTSTAGAAV